MALMAFTLAACTSLPKPIEGASADAFSRIGRFAITVNEESGKQNAVQGGFSWSDDGRHYVLDLTKPDGMFMARDFLIRDGDTVYVTEAPMVQWTKTLNVILAPVNQIRTTESGF